MLLISNIDLNRWNTYLLCGDIAELKKKKTLPRDIHDILCIYTADNSNIDTERLRHICLFAHTRTHLQIQRSNNTYINIHNSTLQIRIHIHITYIYIYIANLSLVQCISTYIYIYTTASYRFDINAQMLGGKTFLAETQTRFLHFPPPSFRNSPHNIGSNTSKEAAYIVCACNRGTIA